MEYSEKHHREFPTARLEAQRKYRGKLKVKREDAINSWVKLHPNTVAAIVSAYAEFRIQNRRKYSRDYQHQNPEMYQRYTEEHRVARAANSRAYYKRNLEAQRGHSKFKHALKKGYIKKGTVCSDCGATNVKIIACSNDDWATLTGFDWICNKCFGKRKRL